MKKLKMDEEKTSRKRFFERCVTFTYYNPDAHECLLFAKMLTDSVQWSYGQVELCPETKRMHFQGMAYSKNSISWSILGTAHKEKCFKPVESLVYCHKLESRYIDNEKEPEKYCAEYGVRPTFNVKGQKLKNLEIVNGDMAKLVEEDKINLMSLPKMIIAKNAYLMLKMKYVHDFSRKRGTYIFGNSGVGKSRYVRDNVKEEDLYVKSLNKWWCNYIGQTNVVLDEVRQEHKEWLLPFLLA